MRWLPRFCVQSAGKLLSTPWSNHDERMKQTGTMSIDQYTSGEPTFPLRVSVLLHATRAPCYSRTLAISQHSNIWDALQTFLVNRPPVPHQIRDRRLHSVAPCGQVSLHSCCVAFAARRLTSCRLEGFRRVTQARSLAGCRVPAASGAANRARALGAAATGWASGWERCSSLPSRLLSTASSSSRLRIRSRNRAGLDLSTTLLTRALGTAPLASSTLFTAVSLSTLGGAHADSVVLSIRRFRQLLAATAIVCCWLL